MKTLVLLFGLLSSFVFSQQQEYIFKFNGKKFKKEFLKTKNQAQSVTLYSVKGETIPFVVNEHSISETPIPNIYTFKGKSKDDQRIISFTLSNNKISGSFSENGVEYYFEPTAKCNQYKVYRQNPNESQIGQEHDTLP